MRGGYRSQKEEEKVEEGLMEEEGEIRVMLLPMESYGIHQASTGRHQAGGGGKPEKVGRSTHRPSNQSTNRPSNLPIDRLTNQSTVPTNQFTDTSVYRWIHIPIHCFFELSTYLITVGLAVHQSTNYSLHQLFL